MASRGKKAEGREGKKEGQTASRLPQMREKRIVWHYENGYSNVSNSHTAPHIAAPARAHTAPGSRRRGRGSWWLRA